MTITSELVVTGVDCTSAVGMEAVAPLRRCPDAGLLFALAETGFAGWSSDGAAPRRRPTAILLPADVRDRRVRGKRSTGMIRKIGRVQRVQEGCRDVCETAVVRWKRSMQLKSASGGQFLKGSEQKTGSRTEVDDGLHKKSQLGRGIATIGLSRHGEETVGDATSSSSKNCGV